MCPIFGLASVSLRPKSRNDAGEQTDCSCEDGQTEVKQ